MSKSLGRIVALLAEPEESLPPNVVALINSNICPPVALTEGDVYVRAMYVVSDEVNSFGGRFGEKEHDRLAELLIDSPVLIGHRKDQLPVGRNFHAELVVRDGVAWVKSYFYWLRSASNGEQLRDNIDGGVYKECSIAFTFRFPECSVCGEDIRQCDHEPFEEYQSDDGPTQCHFNYRQIDKVLETSLVYRGAIPHTSVTRDLDATNDVLAAAASEAESEELMSLDDNSVLDPDTQYLVVPKYDGLAVLVQTENGQIRLVRTDGRPLPCPLLPGRKMGASESAAPLLGRLVGYRGRERCSTAQLDNYLKSRSGPVSRLVLYLFPRQGIIRLPWKARMAEWTLREIPHRLCSPVDLSQAIREVKTRDGVEVWSTETEGSLFDFTRATGYRFGANGERSTSERIPRLKTTEDGRGATLMLTGSAQGRPQSLELAIDRFDPERFRTGGRFVARPVGRNGDAILSPHSLAGLRIEGMQSLGDGFQFLTSSPLAYQCRLRPIRINGHDRYLIYCKLEPVADKEVAGV